MGVNRNLDFQVFFGTIAISFFIIYIWILTQLGRSLDVTKRKMPARQAYSKMKTGDLVFVSYNSMRGKLVKIFTGSMWTHSGMILEEDDGKKIVIEVAYYGSEKYGVLRTPLDEWFKFNDNRVLGWRIYDGKKFPKEQLLKKLRYDEARDIEPDTNLVSWLRTLIKRKHTDPNYVNQDEYFCSEYIMHLLQETKVIQGYMDPQGVYPSGYKPWELLYGNDLPYHTGHSYGPSFMIEG